MLLYNVSEAVKVHGAIRLKATEVFVLTYPRESSGLDEIRTPVLSDA